MGWLSRAISAVIAFVVFNILWTFLSFFVYINPALYGKIGLPSLAPTPMWSAIYNNLAQLSLVVAASGMLLFFFMWGVWRAVKKIVPRVFRKMIGWEFTPFKELKRAGIFRFFDAIFGAIYSLDSVEKRLLTTRDALKDFLMLGIIFIREDIQRNFNKKKSSAYNNKAEKRDPRDDEPPNDDYDPISDETVQKQNEFYQQCLEQNLVSTGDAASDYLTNNTVMGQCKIEQLANSFNLISSRLS